MNDVDMLDYIKETGKEIAELNKTIHDKDSEILQLNQQIADLNIKVGKYETTIHNLRELYNEVYYNQRDLIKDKNHWEKRFIAISETLMCVLPELAKELNGDLKNIYLSEIVDAIEDKERHW